MQHHQEVAFIIALDDANKMNIKELHKPTKKAAEADLKMRESKEERNKKQPEIEVFPTLLKERCPLSSFSVYTISEK